MQTHRTFLSDWSKPAVRFTLMDEARMGQVRVRAAMTLMRCSYHFTHAFISESCTFGVVLRYSCVSCVHLHII